MPDINLAITSFINQSIDKKLIHKIDSIYIRNRLLALLELDAYTQPSVDNPVDILECLDTITTYARKIDNYYQLDLVLRNNRTNRVYPQGIFHPHQDVQHIKKENIGLIEVMGLAILPPRLETEVKAIKGYIQDSHTIEEINPVHQEWAVILKENYSRKDNIESYLEEALGKKFERVLEDSGVFKSDTAGREGFNRFNAFVNDEMK